MVAILGYVDQLIGLPFLLKKTQAVPCQWRPLPLRRRIKNNWQNGYHYFLTTDNLLLVVNPLQTKRLLRDLHNETGKYIDEAEILTELYNKGITKRIKEKTKDFCDVEIINEERTIKLNTLAVMAKKVLGIQEIANMKRFTWRVLQKRETNKKVSHVNLQVNKLHAKS